MREFVESYRKSSASLMQPARHPRRRNRWWFLLVVLLVAAVSRIYVAGRSGLWPDEIFSLALATGHSLEHPAASADPRLGDFIEPDNAVPADQFRRYLRHDTPPATPARIVRAVMLSDTSPPLYYLLLYGWTLLFGTSDLAIRLFSIICSLACPPLLIGIARRIGGSPAVIGSCVLFALSPLSIYYSTEGRMYSLLWLCVLVTTRASLGLQRHGRGVANYLCWILGSAAGFLTHYFFVFPWLAIVAYLLINPGQFRKLPLVTCMTLTAATIFPWYVNLPHSFAGWRITKEWLKWRPPNFHYLSALRDTALQFFSGHERHLWDGHRMPGIVAILLFAVTALVMLWKMQLRVFDRGRLLLGLIFAAACLGPLIFDFNQHTYTVAVPRYAIAALPAAYLLAGYAIGCLSVRMRVIVLCGILLAWSPDFLSLLRNRLPWMPLREIAWSASLNSGPSDIVVVHSIPSGIVGIARYFAGQAEMASWVEQLGNRRTPESLLQLGAGRTRIVLVKVHEVGAAAPEEDWLRANAIITGEIHLGSGEIINFRPRASDAF